MLTPLNIVSFDQGRQPSRSEDDFYRQAPQWRAPAGLGRFLGWLRPAREDRNAANSIGPTREAATGR